MRINIFLLISTLLFQTGCAALFGWDIHAPGLLSKDYFDRVQPLHERVALYIPDHLLHYVSQNRGGRLADPQTYHVGKAMAPMLTEAFQHSFDEFIFLEAEPTSDLMKRYAIPYVVVIDVKDFGNQVTLKGQAVKLTTEVVVLDPDLNAVSRFEANGTSDAQKVFAKPGGPQVNLNAAIESNITATVQLLQDFLKTQKEKGRTTT